MVVTNAELARALSELIEALDRRVPRIDRAGEASIARDAAALRERATTRLAELAKPRMKERCAPLRTTCGSGGK